MADFKKEVVVTSQDLANTLAVGEGGVLVKDKELKQYLQSLTAEDEGAATAGIRITINIS